MINFYFKKNDKFHRKLLISIFLVSLFIVGSKIFHFYGVSLDEWETRLHGFMTLQYIYEIFFSYNISAIESVLSIPIPKLSEFFSKDHGALLDTFFAYIDVSFNITNTKTQYLFRHYFCFIIFFISVYFFYLIGKFRYNDWRIGFLGSLLLVLSPRIFAESFFNNKDIVFMSLFIISLYCCLKFIYKTNIKHAILFAFTSALATDIRLMGIMLPFLTLFFFLYLSLRDKFFLKKNLFPILVFLILAPSFVIFFWPHLWSDPITNFFLAFKKFSAFPWEGKNLYFGNYINAQSVPWHYSLVWIAITTPIIYVILFIIGFFVSSARVIKRLLDFDKQSEFNDIWRGKKEMIDLMILLNFFLPIFLVIILNSTLHDGWRHLYFIYPSLLLLSLYGFEKIIVKLKKINLHNYFLVFIILALGINLVNMIKIHPYQNVYFNFLAGKDTEKRFEADYWGISNKQAIELIFASEKKDIYKIYPASNINLNISKLIFSEFKKNKIKIIDKKNEADFIISNGRFWNGNPDAEFAKIPYNFKLYKEIRTDRTKLVSIYKKEF